MTLFLAVYLAYLLTYFLAFTLHLAYILTLSGIHTPSGIYSDILSGILSGIFYVTFSLARVQVQACPVPQLAMWSRQGPQDAAKEGVAQLCPNLETFTQGQK